jgi:hypothetical protein
MPFRSIEECDDKFKDLNCYEQIIFKSDHHDKIIINTHLINNTSKTHDYNNLTFNKNVFKGLPLKPNSVEDLMKSRFFDILILKFSIEEIKFLHLFAFSMLIMKASIQFDVPSIKTIKTSRYV